MPFTQVSPAARAALCGTRYAARSEVQGADPWVDALFGARNRLEHRAQRSNGLPAVAASEPAFIVAVEAPRAGKRLLAAVRQPDRPGARVAWIGLALDIAAPLHIVDDLRSALLGDLQVPCELADRHRPDGQRSEHEAVRTAEIIKASRRQRHV